MKRFLSLLSRDLSAVWLLSGASSFQSPLDGKLPVWLEAYGFAYLKLIDLDKVIYQAKKPEVPLLQPVTQNRLFSWAHQELFLFFLTDF